MEITMEIIFLIISFIAMSVAVGLDTAQKRREDLAEQKHWNEQAYSGYER